MTTILRPSSIAGEFYLGDKPGTLQYHVLPELLAGLETWINDTNDWSVSTEHTLANLNRVVPDTVSGNKGSWSIILLMQKNVGDESWLKAALKNEKTGEIALMTSTNKKENLERCESRVLKSHDAEWYIGHYRMSAPMIFWEELSKKMK